MNTTFYKISLAITMAVSMAGCQKNVHSREADKSPEGGKAIGEVYLKQGDDYKKLSTATTEFCEKFIRPVHEKDWDWGKRDFENPKNKPDTAEARAMRDFLLKNMELTKNSQIDLSKIKNKEAIKTFLDPKSPNEKFNMGEFADALNVELEHGKIKDANITNNHPLLTSAIVLAHMSESITYYRRLKILEKESKIYEFERKYASDKHSDQYRKKMDTLQKDLATAKEDLQKRLSYMANVPVMEDAQKTN